MSDVHCKFKRLGARLTYGVCTHPWRAGMWPAYQRRRVAFCPCFWAFGGVLILLFLHYLAAFI